jgi:hypothetical protein
MIYDNRVLREYLALRGLKCRDAGENCIMKGSVIFHWKKLHVEELHNFYQLSLEQTVRSARWLWQVARMGAMKNTYKSFTGKPEEKRLIGRHRFI